VVYLGVVPGHLLPDIVILVKLGLLQVLPRDSNRSMLLDLDICMDIQPSLELLLKDVT